MKTIITGSSGFVGKNLAAYLKENGAEVQSLSLRNDDWRHNFDRTATAIIHLAGKAHDTKNTSADEEYFQVNTEQTKKLFVEFRKSDIRDFIYFSSVKAAADSVQGILTENQSPNPKTAYGKSKLAAEEFLLSQNLPSEKRLFIIRPCMIHGPGNKGNLNLLYKVVSKGIPWPLAAFDNKRSFLSIENLNYLILKLLEMESIPSGIYNVSDDKALSTNDVIRIISKSSGKKPRLLKIPKEIFNSVAKIGDVIKLPLNSERLQKLTENYVVSNQKIKTALGIEKLPLSAEDGLEKTIKSFRNSAR